MNALETILKTTHVIDDPVVFFKNFNNTDHIEYSHGYSVWSNANSGSYAERVVDGPVVCDAENTAGIKTAIIEDLLPFVESKVLARDSETGNLSRIRKATDWTGNVVLDNIFKFLTGPESDKYLVKDKDRNDPDFYIGMSFFVALKEFWTPEESYCKETKSVNSDSILNSFAMFELRKYVEKDKYVGIPEIYQM